MKIKSEELKKLLDIIPPYPKVNIFHINNNLMELSKLLYDFCKDKEYDYELFCSDEEFMEKLKPFGVEKFDIKAKRYNRHSKLYDFIFLNMDFKDIKDKQLFLKKIYHISKNSAKILIFLDKKDFNLEQMLEELNFVALNYIDISNDYEILSAQKMHGWGVYDMK